MGTGLVFERQKDGEGSSCILRSHAALYLNGSAVFTDDFRANPQPEASSGIAFGADKWLKKRLPDLRVYSGSGIRDGQTNAGPRSIPVFVRVGDPNLQPAASADCVDSISYQV